MIILNCFLSTLWKYISANKFIIFLFTLVFSEFAYMHFEIAPREYVTPFYKWVLPVEFMLFDAFVLLLTIGLLVFWRLKIAYTISFVCSFLWSLTNVVYSRYFHQYMPVSAISEAGNLTGSWWFEYFIGALKISDLFYPLSIWAFVFCIKRTEAVNMLKKIYWICPALILVFHAVTYPLIYKTGIADFVDKNFGKTFFNKYVYDTDYLVLYSGTFRSHVYCNLHNLLFDVDYFSDEEKADMRNHLLQISNKNRPTDSMNIRNVSGKNIVFIIVESYLSMSSDLIIGDKVITPNLNKLRHLRGTYYNGNVRQNIAKGESSDGQFILMTGLLPLSNELTVSKILKNTIPSFPAIMRDSCNYSTHITIPTRPSFWHQNDVNKVYGIDSLYSIVSPDGKMTPDKDIFEFALLKEKTMSEPYLHIILTASMHGTYENLQNGVPNCVYDFPHEYSPELKNYLCACHYTDSIIGDYISKRDFDNTIFIITSDHEAHKELLVSEDSVLNNLKLPFYIVNADIDTFQTVKSEINQIDIYPSLLDLMGIRTHKRGLGHSIFDINDYDEHISDTLTRISEFIIRDNYFKNFD